ncbi:MAG TPA: hypothetical protein VLB74_05770 [Flavobacterium sp.]|uniref:hypothetical protein n=1 Tax=Flavobacterium sp. TaxID=239 RepID=UPI002C8D0B4A|nr:hypothetical protein [Flavobacterium sp.]HSD14134.1 hypothetical protein [Flavobacterium sp.]
MKKILICSFAILALTSCEKEEGQLQNQKTNNSTSITDKPVRMREYYDFGYKFGCAGTSGNCLPDLIIWSLTQQQQNVFNELFKEDANILEIFNNEKTTLTEIIEPAIVDSVINETSFLEIKKDTDLMINYLVFKDNANIITDVYPIDVK